MVCFSKFAIAMIHYFSEETEFVLKNKRLVSKWLTSIAASNGRKIGNLNYIFCSDPYLLDINKRYLGHDYYTDIITFDNSTGFEGEAAGEKIEGDIYISVDTVKANGVEYGEGFDREIHRVIAHGLLHLIGFDDTCEKLQKEMRRQENLALNLYQEMKNDGKI